MTRPAPWTLPLAAISGVGDALNTFIPPAITTLRLLCRRDLHDVRAFVLLLEVPPDRRFARAHAFRPALASQIRPGDHARIAEIRLHTSDACRNPLRTVRGVLGPILSFVPARHQRELAAARDAERSSSRSGLLWRSAAGPGDTRETVRADIQEGGDMLPLQVRMLTMRTCVYS